MTRAIILCAGRASRWHDHLGVPKQLAPVLGEPILPRTVRLLRERGVCDIHIVAHDERFRLAGCGWLSPIRSDTTVDSFLSTRGLWAERTVVLAGDVWFSEAAMTAIVTDIRRIVFFGRPNFSRYTACGRPEVFGFAFSSGAWEEVADKATFAGTQPQTGTTLGKLWSFYYAVVGPPLRMWLTERELFQIIDDFTDDFDTEADHRWWHRCRAWACARQPWRRWVFGAWVGLLAPVYYLTIPRRRIHPLWLFVYAILCCQAWWWRLRSGGSKPDATPDGMNTPLADRN